MDELSMSAAVLLLITNTEGHAAMLSMQQLAVSWCETETVTDASSALSRDKHLSQCRALNSCTRCRSTHN